MAEPFVVGDVNYAEPENVLGLRAELIAARNVALSPSAFNGRLAVTLTHAIGYLAAVIRDKWPDANEAIAAQASPALREPLQLLDDPASALRNVIEAWEQLEYGNRSISAVQRWLTDPMKPAIDRGRRVLGMPTEPPHG